MLSHSGNKTIARNTIILYVRMIVMMLVTLYTSRVVLEALGEVDYGLYNVVGGVVVFIGFLNATMSSASSRYITVAVENPVLLERQKIFSSIFFVNVIIACIVLILSETVGLWFLFNKLQIPPERQIAVFWVYQISVITILSSIVCIAYNATIIAHERMKAFAYITLVDAIAKLLVAFVILQPRECDKLIMYVCLLFLIQLTNQLLYFLYCRRSFPETSITFKFCKGQMFDIYKYIGWSSYGSFATAGFTQGLNILLNIFFGPAVNAARGVAVQVYNAILSFSVNSQIAINPQLIKSVSLNNFNRSKNLLDIGTRFSFFLLCIIAVPLIGQTEFILSVWLKNVPEHAVNFVRIILTIGVIQSLAFPIRTINQAEGNIKQFQIFECSWLLFIVPCSYFFLKLGCAPESVFFIQLFFEILAQYIRTRLVLYKINVKSSWYYTKVYLRVVPVLIISLPIAIILSENTQKSMIGFLYSTLIVESFIIVYIYIFGIKKQEKEWLISKLRAVYYGR